MTGGISPHWLTFFGESDDAAPLLPNGFLVGPENLLVETAVDWALGGVPFFADSPESTALWEAVASSKKRAASKKENLWRKEKGERKRRENEDAAPFGSPVIDYTPLVNLPNAFPLLFYGPSGSGKSHLAHGVFREYLRQHTKRRGIYLSGDDFYRALTRAIAERRTDEWRTYFAECGIVVFDGIHALVNRVNAQKELLAVHSLCERSRTLLLLTSLEAPQRTEKFIEPLASRLSGGLTVPVVFPGEESRRVLIDQFAESCGVKLSGEAIDFLTESLPPAAGAMAGAFRQMKETLDWPNRPVSLAKMRLFLEARRPEKELTLEQIARKCAEQFAVKYSEIRSKSRTKTVVLARNMAIYLARTRSGPTLEELGRWFGGRDHTTILHGFRDMEARLEADPELAAARDAILLALGSK